MMGAHPWIGADSPVLSIRGNLLVVEKIKGYLVSEANTRIDRLIPHITALLARAQSLNSLIMPALITWAQRAFDQQLDEDLQYRDAFRVEEQIAYDFYACVWRMSPAYIQALEHFLRCGSVTRSGPKRDFPVAPVEGWDQLAFDVDPSIDFGQDNRLDIFGH